MLARLRAIRRLASTSAIILEHGTNIHKSIDLLNLGISKKFQSGGIRANNKSRRAYEQVSVRPVDHHNEQAVGYCIGMDDKILVTPKGNIVVLPSEVLAKAVAAEWERQGQLLKPTSMPLFALTSSALDGFTDLESREANKKILYNYIATDTVCFRSPSLEKLADRQDRVLNPLIDWVNDEYGIQLSKTYSFEPINHPQESVEKLMAMLDELDPWSLAVFDSLTKITKSYVIALATVKGRLNAQQAYIASRVEEELQIQTWGEVEGGHDIDTSYTKVKILAATVFLRMVHFNE